jgi:hypothetical protein
MTTSDIVDFLRGNGQRLCPPGLGESCLSDSKHQLGRELQHLADIIERRGGA